MKKPFSRLSLLLAFPMMLSACGKGMHMTVPNSGASTLNNAGGTTQPTSVTVAKDGSSIMLGTSDPSDTLGNAGDLYLNSTSGDLFQKGSGAPAWQKKGNLKGPTGATGASGKNGTNGTNGSNGVDGASFDPSKNFNTGVGAPLASANLNGLYLDTSTGNLYSVKAGQPSQLIMNLKGPAGVNDAAGTPGTSGQQFLNGIGAPAKVLGNLQDVYIDTTSGDLYRKTDATTWTLFYSVGTKPAPADNSPSTFTSGSGAPTAQTMPIGSVYMDLDTCTFYHRNADGSIQILFQKNSPILSGHGDASDSLGNLGDLYLDIDSHNLYQKLDAKSWTFLMNLNGAPGKDGDTTTTVVNVPAPPAVLLSLEDEQLHFALNSSAVSTDGLIKLRNSAIALEKYDAQITEVEIKGQTDRTGSVAYNKTLAQARADAVAKILLTKLSSRIVDAYGLGEPAVSSCPTDECIADRWVHIGIQLSDSLTLDQRNAIISDLNTQFNAIWK